MSGGCFKSFFTWKETCTHYFFIQPCPSSRKWSQWKDYFVSCSMTTEHSDKVSESRSWVIWFLQNKTRWVSSISCPFCWFIVLVLLPFSFLLRQCCQFSVGWVNRQLGDLIYFGGHCQVPFSAYFTSILLSTLCVHSLGGHCFFSATFLGVLSAYTLPFT